MSATANLLIQQIDHLLKEAEAIAMQAPVQAEVLARRALQIATDNGLDYEQCLAMLSIADIKENLAQNDAEAESNLHEAIRIAGQHGFTALLIRAYCKYASLLNSTNRIELAEENIRHAKYYLNEQKPADEKMALQVLYDELSIRYRKGEAGPSLLADCLAGLQKATAIQDEGFQTCFLQMLIMQNAAMGEVHAAIDYSKRFLALEEKRGFHMSVMGAYVFQSGLYEKAGNPLEAEASFEKALAAAKQLGDMRSYFSVELRRVQFLLKNERYTEAKLLCEELMQMPVKDELPKQRYELTVCLCRIAEAENRLNDAVQLIENERSLFQEDKIVLQKLTGYLHELYAKAGDFSSAYRALSAYQNLTQEIFDLQKAKEYAELHTRFETKEKEARLRETELRQLDAELKAIKSQMNPHFAFNTLKTIDYLLEQNNVSDARQSLNDFAQLMRATLEQSGSEFTVIEDEVLLLNNYLRLEKNALGDSFSYHITVDDNIDISYERVPSIFLQPIVENAIKHGLRHKHGPKLLQVSFQLKNDMLEITVEDNGIGRAASAELNKFRANHHSFAGNALLKRVAFLNEKAGYTKYEFTVEDVMPGTKATLCIRQSQS